MIIVTTGKSKYTYTSIKSGTFCGFCNKKVHPTEDGDPFLFDYCTCIYGWRDRGVVDGSE